MSANDFVITWTIPKFQDVLVSLHPSNPEKLSTLCCEILNFYPPELSCLLIIRSDHNIWGLEGCKAHCCPHPACMRLHRLKNTLMLLLSAKHILQFHSEASYNYKLDRKSVSSPQSNIHCSFCFFMPASTNKDQQQDLNWVCPHFNRAKCPN